MYDVIAAAKYLGVTPWDLAAQPAAWREWAHICMEAEAHAAEVRQSTKK